METLKKIILISFLTGFIFMNAFSDADQYSGTNSNAGNLCETGPTVTAGPDATSCTNGSFVTQGEISGPDGFTLWRTSGDGTFSHPYNLNSTYTPGVKDIRNGFVKLTLIYVHGGIEFGGIMTDDMILQLAPCLGGNEFEVNKVK
jgi:hypothetical protein